MYVRLTRAPPLPAAVFLLAPRMGIAASSLKTASERESDLLIAARKRAYLHNHSEGDDEWRPSWERERGEPIIVTIGFFLPFYLLFISIAVAWHLLWDDFLLRPMRAYTHLYISWSPADVVTVLLRFCAVSSLIYISRAPCAFIQFYYFSMPRA